MELTDSPGLVQAPAIGQAIGHVLAQACGAAGIVFRVEEL